MTDVMRRAYCAPMKPRELLSESVTPDGAPITLTREAEALVVRVSGVPLMSSRVHGSEDAMAEVGCAPLRAREGARVLVGGLGMGFTLRATLDALGSDAEVVVSELLPIVVEWNRGPLAPLAGRPLEDPRVRLEVGHLAALVKRSPPRSYDALLLDVDNGPEAFTVASNAWLYARPGIDALKALLRPGGALVVWSASKSPRFERDLRAAGLTSEVVPVRARGPIKKGSRHLLYVGRAGL